MSMFGNRGWTDQDDAILRRMAVEGASKIRICVRLRRTETAITKRAATLGLALRRKRDGSAQSPRARTSSIDRTQ